MQVLYFSMFFGLIAGLCYTILKNLAVLLNSNKIAYIICDIVSMISAGILFFYCILTYNSGVIRLYIFCAFALGFLIEIVSIGNLVDFSINFVYNKIKLGIKKTKLLKTRRKQNGAKKTQ